MENPTVPVRFFWFPTRSFDAVAVPFRPAPALVHHFMALPLLLIDDAVHAIALLGGRDGLKLDQLFPRLPRLPKADDACKAFIWRKLCSHPELSLSCEGRTKAQILALNVADAGDVLLIASERLRAHLCGVREETDARGHATFKSKEAESVMSVASRHGVTGVLQNALTKLVGVAANKLAYTLFVLEIDRLLHRQAVYRRTVETGGRGKKRASPAQLAPPLALVVARLLTRRTWRELRFRCGRTL